MSNSTRQIHFSTANSSGRELQYLKEAMSSGTWGGDAQFSKRCTRMICEATGAAHSLVTHSCTAALEMSAFLARIGPGDEVIMPSFTFVSTANAVALRGATPVFVDIRPDTLNIDEKLIEEAVGPRTKAVFVVHYAGVCCAMDEINGIARRRGLLVVEDAAQAYLSTYKGRPAGSLGDMAAFSFHETKNITSGEGGAFVTGNLELARHAEIVWQKGTDRGRFMRGEVDKYTWVDLGSSYLPSELVAAVLLAQLEEAPRINAQRILMWERYDAAFADLERKGLVRRPIIPSECTHNGHLYYLLMPDAGSRDALIKELRELKIGAPFHYVPLHSSPAGRRFGRFAGELPLTDELSARLVRMPLHLRLDGDDIDRVIGAVRDFVDHRIGE
jgi:dTDP-4-amino-4,6-dideoxygalactose transaminase